MKCDVCGTRIPVGHHECPNCGYKVNGKYASVYNGSSQNHEHIPNPPVKRGYIPPKVNVDVAKNISFGKDKSSILIAVLITAIVFCAILMTVVPKYLDRIEASQVMSFQQAINKGYDEDGTIVLALSQEDNIIAFMEGLGLQNVKIDEYLENGCNIATIVTVGNLTDITYSLSVTYSNNKSVERSVSISNQTHIGMRETKQLTIDKDIYNQLLSYCGMSQTSESIESLIPNMIKVKYEDQNDSNAYEYVDINEPYISIFEEYYEDTDMYYQSIVVTQQV